MIHIFEKITNFLRYLSLIGLFLPWGTLPSQANCHCICQDNNGNINHDYGSELMMSFTACSLRCFFDGYGGEWYSCCPSEWCQLGSPIADVKNRKKPPSAKSLPPELVEKERIEWMKKAK